MKQCNKCKQFLPLNMFSKNKEFKDGLQYCCKVCANQYGRQYYHEHKGYFSKCGKEYRNEHGDNLRKKDVQLRNTLVGRYKHWNKKANARGIDWHLSLDDIKQIPLICHYTGMPLVTESHHWNTVSLDRMDSNKAYTKDNVVFCCGFINKMKLTLSYGQFISTCAKIVEHHAKMNRALN